MPEIPSTTEEQEELTPCPLCDTDTDPNDTHPNPSGGDGLCEDCFVDHATYCEWCDDPMWHDDGHHLEYYSVSVCYRCTYDLYNCERCSVQISSDDAQYFDDGEYESCYCPDCYADAERQGGWVRRWGDKPAPDFIHTDGITSRPRPNAWYMGMEIEVEGDAYVNLRDAFADIHDRVGEVYYTTDGSLIRGLEIVTHPGTFDAWREGKVLKWDEWAQYIHGRVPDQTQFNTNGIHIHVSRDAFNNSRGIYQTGHVYRFMHFIQHHKDAVGTIAGRGEADYCRWNFARDLKVRKLDAIEKRGARSDRYRPVNMQNQNTIEIRIFDGRTDKPFIMRAIEFIHSTVEFTRLAKSKLPDWAAYDAYVRDNKEMYPNLYDLLKDDEDLLILAAANRIVNKREVKQVLAEAKEEERRERRRRRDQIERDRRAQRLANSANEVMQRVTDCDCEQCNEARLQWTAN